MSTEHSMATLLARVAELERALRPFAKIGKQYIYARDDRVLLSVAGGNITIGDAKRAHAAARDTE